MPEDFDQFFQELRRRGCPPCPPCRCGRGDNRRDDRRDDRRGDRRDDHRDDRRDRDDNWPWR